ncbi:MAG: YbhN family protein [Actinomycetota bacterium]|nr:YbhN family protein [Actinomycetota bacterium]
MIEQVQPQPGGRDAWKTIAIRSFFLLVALGVLYILWPQLVTFLSATRELSGIDWYWFLLMAALMTGAFTAAWELTHIAVRGITRFVATTSQLTANALAKVIPGGPVAAGVTYFQMLSVSGVPHGQAAASLAAVAFISNLVLFSLPAIAILLAAFSAPIPRGLLPIGVVGTALFALLFTAVFTVVKYDKPLVFVGRIVETVVGWLAVKLRRDWAPTAQEFLDRRNEVVDALGRRWQQALAAAVLNWTLDYMVLLVALVAVGAQPRPSLVLLAFAGAAVLGMIPLTPGGLGFVEIGLTAMLVASGIPGPDATLAVLVYRLFQFWIPIPAGAVAYAAFKRKYGKPADLEGSTA